MPLRLSRRRHPQLCWAQVEGPRAWQRRRRVEKAGLGGREKFAGMAIEEKDDPQGDITLDVAAVAMQQVDDPLKKHQSKERRQQ